MNSGPAQPHPAPWSVARGKLSGAPFVVNAAGFALFAPCVRVRQADAELVVDLRNGRRLVKLEQDRDALIELIGQLNELGGWSPVMGEAPTSIAVAWTKAVARAKA